MLLILLLYFYCLFFFYVGYVYFFHSCYHNLVNKDVYISGCIDRSEYLKVGGQLTPPPQTPSFRGVDYSIKLQTQDCNHSVTTTVRFEVLKTKKKSRFQNPILPHRAWLTAEQSLSQRFGHWASAYVEWLSKSKSAAFKLSVDPSHLLLPPRRT